MNRFEYTDPDGDTLTAEPWHRASGPTVFLLFGTLSDGDTASLAIPLDRLEEVIAGMRDMARQAAYAAAYHQPSRFPGDSAAMRAAAISGVRSDRRRLTEIEHTAAWHAIEGAAAEEGADPGTVLNAVLRALGIDPPAAVQHEAAHPADCQCIPASPMAPRIYADCCLPAASPTP